jgi:lipoprotein-anchoring transpeptidase ErfK/SrfK
MSKLLLLLLGLTTLIAGCAYPTYPELPADIAAQHAENRSSAAVASTSGRIDRHSTGLAAAVADRDVDSRPVSQEVFPPPPDPQALPIADQRQLKILLGDKRFEYYEDDALVWAGKISAGRPGKETPKGDFRVTAKDINKRSGSYTNYFNWPTPMPYALQFSGPYWVHEGYVPNEHSSAGCVRLRHEDAKFVYARMRIGDPVSVVQ